MSLAGVNSGANVRNVSIFIGDGHFCGEIFLENLTGKAFVMLSIIASINKKYDYYFVLHIYK